MQIALGSVHRQKVIDTDQLHTVRARRSGPKLFVIFKFFSGQMVMSASEIR